MAKQVYADNVDANGKVYKTVGENIRQGAREGEMIDVNSLLKRIENDETDIETLYEQGNTLASSIQTVSDNLDSYKDSMESGFSLETRILYNGTLYGYDRYNPSKNLRFVVESTFCQDKLITDILIYVSKIGTITYGFLTSNNLRAEENIDSIIPLYSNQISFSSTGLKQITFTNPIYVPKNGYIFFGSTNDSGGIGYYISDQNRPFYNTLNALIYTPNDETITLNNTNVGLIVSGKIKEPYYKYKTASILGDSISTFKKTIPDTYAYYYPRDGVESYSVMWWSKVINSMQLEKNVNASWSGSKVTGDSTSTTGEVGCSDARINELSNNTNPDIIFVYIGTNDFASNVTLGTFTSTDEIPEDGTITEFSKAYALMLHKIRNTYPDSVVYCITSFEGRRVSGDTTYPVKNTNGNTLHEFNHQIKEIAHIFSCNVIDLNEACVNFWDISKFTVDGTLHPNALGMQIIADKVIETLKCDAKRNLEFLSVKDD